MSETLYDNFDVVITKSAGNSYRAEVLSTPGGDASNLFEMPFSDQEMKAFLIRLGRPGQDPEGFENAAKEFGGRLCHEVFKTEMFGCLRVSHDDAIKRGNGIRIRLHLTEVPRLAALPWEYLYSPVFNFFARSPETPIVRYLKTPPSIRRFDIGSPLRVLVMTSSPSGYQVLKAEGEWERLTESFEELRRQGDVQLDLLENGTEAALHDRLERKGYNVFHFIGHGRYDAERGRGCLIFEDEGGKGREIYGPALANLLGGRSKLRLAIINACEGARASLTDPFGGLAQSLVEVGLQAVIAMQFNITDSSAVTFAGAFYNALKNYSPVDTALSEARKAMNAEWGTPALFMRTPDGRIFAGDSIPPPPSPRDPIEMQYQFMIKAAREGNLVIFLGARANLCGRQPGEWQEGRYPPSDRELAEHLTKVSSLPGGDRDLAEVSQYIALGDAEFLSDQLHAVFTSEFCTTPLHKFLATLPRTLSDPGHAHSHLLIVTTNYDDVLEESFKAEPEEYDLVWYVAEGKHGGKFFQRLNGAQPVLIPKGSADGTVSLDRRTVILKINGAVDRSGSLGDSYVITEDQYVDHFGRTDFCARMPANLRDKLQDKDSRFLFLGYWLRDWNLRIMFRRIWGEEGPKSTSWAIIESEPDPFDEEFWNKRHVKTLNVKLKDFVERLNSLLKP